MAKTRQRKSLEIKISTVVAISAILHETDPARLEAALQELTGGTQDYFDNEFAVLDIGALTNADADAAAHAGAGIDWEKLIALFRSHRLNPVAVRNAAPELHAAILAHGLSLDTLAPARAPEAAPDAAPGAAQAATAAPAAAAAAAIPGASPTAAVVTARPSAGDSAMRGAMIIDTPVRAGRRIYAQGCDLIITAAVNNGAEVIADGSIHIYAPLRGRALAGASGNTEARIFALSMEAELVSIAGMYRNFEDGLPSRFAQQAAEVRLQGDRIDIRKISQ